MSWLKPASLSTWQYKVVTPTLNVKVDESYLNALGVQGWSLIAVIAGPEYIFVKAG